MRKRSCFSTLATELCLFCITLWIWNSQAPDREMSYGDLIRIIGYQCSSSNDVHQGDTPQSFAFLGSTKLGQEYPSRWDNADMDSAAWVPCGEVLLWPEHTKTECVAENIPGGSKQCQKSTQVALQVSIRHEHIFLYFILGFGVT